MYFCSVSLLERTSGNNGHEIVVKVLHAHHIAYYSPQITDYSEVSNVNLLLTLKMHLKRAILASIKYCCSSQAPDCNCLMSTHVSKTMIPFMIFVEDNGNILDVVFSFFESSFRETVTQKQKVNGVL